MALLDTLATELLGPKSVGELSKSSGADKGQVQQLVTKALPLLLSGMYQNSSTEAGAKSLEKALDEHAPSAQKSTSAMLKQADVSDGRKIVQHVLGKDEKKVTTDLAASTGLSQSQVTTLLGQLAPVVLSLVGNFKQEEQSSKGNSSSNLVSILGTALLGNSYQKTDKSSQGGLNLASLAGALLGGSSSDQQGSSGLGSMLGSLLGTAGTAQPAPAAKTGTTKSGTAKSGTTKSGTAKSDTTKSGTAKSDTTKSGTAKSGTTKSGTAKSGTTKSGTAKSDTAKSGTTKSGTAKSGTSKSGTAKSGTTKSDTAKSKEQDSGISLSSMLLNLLK